MRIIHHADSRVIMEKQSLPDLLKGMPADVKQRASRYRFDRDAYNFVTGRLLLQKGLEELGLNTNLSLMSYQENGKPLLPGIYFNISHSGYLVVCVLSTSGEIGIDVEVRGDVKLDSFVNYFTGPEWKDITSAEDPIHRFYFYWTRKEAVIKALGVNLSWLHDIELDATGASFVANGRKWILEDVALEGTNNQNTYCVICY